jgi:hypothetical protein
MNAYLKKLPLSLPTGSIVEPFSFNENAINSLKKWLDADQVEALRSRAEIAKHQLQEERTEPMLGAQRQVLQRAGELASSLAKLLDQAPQAASGELDQVFHEYMGGYQQREIMCMRLGILAKTLEQRLDRIPAQDRRKSPVFFVSLIAEVTHAAGIKTSASENARFFKVCQIVFESAGIPFSPAAPIKAFMKK